MMIVYYMKYKNFNSNKSITYTYGISGLIFKNKSNSDDFKKFTNFTSYRLWGQIIIK